MTEAKPSHAAMNQFPVDDDCLVVGGIKLTRLVEQVGGTPFFAYDRKLISRRIRLLRDKLPAKIRLHYAVKANPMPAVIQHIAGMIDGMDVASAGEMKLALDSPARANQISMAGPGKRNKELRQAIAAGVILNIESESELLQVHDAGIELGIRPQIAVRINPDFALRGSGMKMGGGPSPFGIDEERIPELLTRIRSLDLDFVGLHIFAGSQNLNAEAIIIAQRQCIELAIRLSSLFPGTMQKLNIGGGFGIPYFPGDRRLNLDAVGEALAEGLQQVETTLPGTDLILELGRYIVGEAGIYVCRILDRKISRGQVYLVTDGGLHHHLAASGNFGQVIRKNFPVAIGNRMVGNFRETVNIVGPLCTPLDIIANQIDVSQADIGDLVVVFQSGAYGFSASPSAFLSQPKAQEWLV